MVMVMVKTIQCPKERDKNTDIDGQDAAYISMVFHPTSHGTLYLYINEYFPKSFSFYVNFVRKPLKLFDLEIVTFFVMWYCI
jgi:hypothetical protein